MRLRISSRQAAAPQKDGGDHAAGDNRGEFADALQARLALGQFQIGPQPPAEDADAVARRQRTATAKIEVESAPATFDLAFSPTAA